MNNNVGKYLFEKIKDFISGIDVSIAAANEIEVGISDQFADCDLVEETVIMLASYRPGGGDYLYDEFAVKRQLSKFLDFTDR